MQLLEMLANGQVRSQAERQGPLASCFCFSKFCIFDFLRFFFSFLLTWDHIGEKCQTTSPLKVHITFTPPKIMHTHMVGLYQSCSKNWEISNFGFLPFFFFSFSLTWDHMGVKVTASPLKEPTRFAPQKFMHTHGKGLYQSC